MRFKVKNLIGKSALILAGSKGLGLACAESFAAAGASVHIVARDEKTLQLAANKIQGEYQVEVDFSALDLTNAEELRAFLKDQSPDILLTNCGGPPVAPFESFNTSDWTQAFNSVVLSTAVATSELVPKMAAKGWGRVLMVGSCTINSPLPGFTLSNVLRKSIVGFAESITQEFAEKGVTANVLNPGYTKTQRLTNLIASKAESMQISVQEVEAEFLKSIPVNRLGEPKELAAMAAFLASDEAGFITAQSIDIDGGQSVSV